MNSSQKKIVAIGGAILLCLCLFVPWKATYDVSAVHGEYGRPGVHYVNPAGYAFIGSPPAGKYLEGVSIDLPRMAVPIGIVAAAAITALVLFRKQG